MTILYSVVQLHIIIQIQKPVEKECEGDAKAPKSKWTAMTLDTVLSFTVLTHNYH